MTGLRIIVDHWAYALALWFVAMCVVTSVLCGLFRVGSRNDQPSHGQLDKSGRSLESIDHHEDFSA